MSAKPHFLRHFQDLFHPDLIFRNYTSKWLSDMEHSINCTPARACSKSEICLADGDSSLYAPEVRGGTWWELAADALANHVPSVSSHLISGKQVQSDRGFKSAQ